jgi:hypothetical protein
MNVVRSVTLGIVIFSAQSTLAADADNGKRQAQQHCSPCHIIEPNQRQELADSPPFETIARKYGNAPKQQKKALKAAWAGAKEVPLPDPQQLWSKWPETLIGYGLGKELGAIPITLLQPIAGAASIKSIKSAYDFS